MSTAMIFESVSQETYNFLKHLGKEFSDSQMFGCKTPAQGTVLAMECFVRRVPPTTILETYHLIENKLSMRADAMLAGFNAIGGKHEIISRTPQLASIKLTHEGKIETFSFSIDEAKAEPFVWEKDGKSLKKNWRTPRAAMQSLWARVCSDGVRAVAPQVVAGKYTPEECEDMDDGPNVVPSTATTVSETPVTNADTSGEQTTAKKRGRPKNPEPAPAATSTAATPEAASVPTGQTAATAEVAPPGQAPVIDQQSDKTPLQQLDTRELKIARIEGKKGVMFGYWGEQASEHWRTVMTRLGVDETKPLAEVLPDEKIEKLDAWLDRAIDKRKEEERKQSLETWANQQVP